MKKFPEDFRFPEDFVELPIRHDYLPENFVIHFTALEAGFLAGLLFDVKLTRPQLNRLKVRVQGRAGEMSMLDRLIEKLEQEHKKPH